jgi:hypothetical protein
MRYPLFGDVTQTQIVSWGCFRTIGPILKGKAVLVSVTYYQSMLCNNLEEQKSHVRCCSLSQLHLAHLTFCKSALLPLQVVSTQTHLLILMAVAHMLTH